jgi:hypothetical protein
LRQAWYQTRSAFKGDTLYQGWTFPILMGDTTKPAFQDRFVANLKSVIDEFKIDALHIDAGFFYIPQPGKELFYKMRNAAPQVAIGAENYLTFEEMNFYHFSQIARLHLKNYRGTLRLAADCSSYAAQEGLDELYAWLNKPSPVCRFAKDYIIVYPHLCAADAFVPIGKVCNLEPPRQMPPTKQEQWKMLAEAKRLDFTPAIRVNYRKYGLDADSRKAIRELGR